ncbi:hypothetical protein [Streptomyces sp. GESEQ-4]|uniref:hypothetical protein n=1 Tax=Streptomyces sp. GESEQ-4 TaxID=2812655 RepID=UPI001B33FD27|nr:hypothetical protein [Streptomyces sp. GESEQ-4]
MTTPAAVADRVAEILGGRWKAAPGPWESYGRLDAPEADTYTLHVDDHGELCLRANLDPTGEIASFREVRTPEGIKAVTEAIAEAIRQHHTTADQE